MADAPESFINKCVDLFCDNDMDRYEAWIVVKIVPAALGMMLATFVAMGWYGK